MVFKFHPCTGGSNLPDPFKIHRTCFRTKQLSHGFPDEIFRNPTKIGSPVPVNHEKMSISCPQCTADAGKLKHEPVHLLALPQCLLCFLVFSDIKERCDALLCAGYYIDREENSADFPALSDEPELVMPFCLVPVFPAEIVLGEHPFQILLHDKFRPASLPLNFLPGISAKGCKLCIGEANRGIFFNNDRGGPGILKDGAVVGFALPQGLLRVLGLSNISPD